MKKKYYAVAKGRKTGIFTSWDDCKKQVNGFSGAIFKSFKSIQDAKEFLQKHSNSNTENGNSNFNKKRKIEELKIKR